jgi:hypothetical protein
VVAQFALRSLTLPEGFFAMVKLSFDVSPTIVTRSHLNPRSPPPGVLL